MTKIAKKRSVSTKHKSKIVKVEGQIQFRRKRKNEHVVEVENLSDEDWKKLSSLALLPTDARFRIAAAIGMYRNRTAAVRGSLASKRRVMRMRNAIRRLLNDAESLQADPIFFNIGLAHWGSRTGPSPTDITQRVESISELDQILADAEDRMRLKRGRKSSSPIEALINHLAWIQADATKKYLKRSTKAGSLRPINAFLSACVKIADQFLSASRIENILTRCIAEHHRTLKKDGFDTAIGEYVALATE